MKKIAKAVLSLFLQDYKWYRKKEKGTWYKVQDDNFAAGFGGPFEYWTSDPKSLPVIKIEKY